MIPSAAVKKIAACRGIGDVQRDRDRDERQQEVGPSLGAEQKSRVRRSVIRVGHRAGQPMAVRARPGSARDLDSARVRTRRFGDTDLEASEIGFGTWALGSTWWGDVSESEGERLLHEALELGITFFETGDAYGQGANEELVGRVLGSAP